MRDKNGGSRVKKLIFNVTFLSDVVLLATSNTEGNSRELDFIPGSAFLGMVAKEYESFSDSFQIFHSGDVRFGDGHLLCNNQPTFKMPLSYFHEKLDMDATQIYNHHFIDDFSKFQQLKQLRSGYITAKKELATLEYNYTQKSAYDATHRRSKEGSMYGYSALQKGLQWQFSVFVSQSVDTQSVEKIKELLQKSTQLGKSKSAQYGKIRIDFVAQESVSNHQALEDEIVLYAKSRIALHDEMGHPTYDVRYLCDGLNAQNIVMSKSQIRTFSFTPYNNARKTEDSERFCIEKGSVIVLKDITPKQLEQLQGGVGAYLSEGFGEVLINPEFIMDKKPFSLVQSSKEQTKQNQREKITEAFSDTTLEFLAHRHNATIKKLDLAQEVADFIAKNGSLYNKKMNSQWGTIRSLCSSYGEDEIYSEVQKYISHGVAKEKWAGAKGEKLLQAIENATGKVAFTKLLAMQMPKVKALKESSND